MSFRKSVKFNRIKKLNLYRRVALKTSFFSQVQFDTEKTKSSVTEPHTTEYIMFFEKNEVFSYMWISYSKLFSQGIIHMCSNIVIITDFPIFDSIAISIIRSCLATMNSSF